MNTVAVCEEFRQLVAEQGLPLGKMPDKRMIRSLNPTLVNRIECIPGGGWRKVAALLGWEASKPTKKRGTYQRATYPSGYFDSMDNVRKELDDFIAENGDVEEMTENVMPTYKHLKRRPALSNVVRRHGGPEQLAIKLNMCTPADWM